MNALYVTVSIPLLLVLAGFNHAHGLTTFGKTQSNNQAAPPQPTAKSCENHASCKGIQGTSCVPEPRDPMKMSCLCGDNTTPRNGKCESAVEKGPKHLCSENTQCVEGAQCISMGNKNGNGQEMEKTCKCMEGYIELNSSCSGAGIISLLNGWILLVIATSTFALSKQL